MDRVVRDPDDRGDRVWLSGVERDDLAVFVDLEPPEYFDLSMYRLLPNLDLFVERLEDDFALSAGRPVDERLFFERLSAERFCVVLGFSCRLEELDELPALF